MDQHIQEGKAFLEAKLATGDYHSHPSGFIYRFITEGQTGKGESNNSSAKPGPTSKVQVHYEGKLINGKIFDSSWKRGETITFGLDQVIKGWGLAVQMMSYGDKIEIVLPQELAYGQRGAGKDIPPGATLIFVIEYFETKKSKAEIEGQEFYLAQQATGDWIEHPEGYLYKWLSEPPTPDAPKPDAQQQCLVHYVGTLIDGTEFDSSLRRGQPIEMALSRVIPGWTSCCQMMTEGSKLKVILPPNLAYSSESPTPLIAPFSTLIFEIELFSWKPAPPQDCTIV